MPNPITVPQRRPSTPAQVQASAARYAANNGGVLGQANFSELHPSLQKKITDQFGIPQTEWDNPNSYYANLLRTQLGAANKDADNMRFQTYASDYKRFAGTPQKIKALDNNIGWDRENQRWLPHKNDVQDPLGAASQGVRPPVTPGSQGVGRVAGGSVAPVGVPPTGGMPNPSAGIPPAKPTDGVNTPGGNPPVPGPQNVSPPPSGPTTGPSAVPPVSAPASPSGGPLQRVKSSTKPAMPAEKQGAAMNDKQMFKVAFLAKCVEDGLTLDQIHMRVKQALVLAEKKANKDGSSFWDAWNPLAIAKDMSWAGLAGAGVVGAGGYYMGNKVLGPGAYHLTKAPIPSKEDLLQEELVNEYDRQTDIIKRQTEMTKRKRERDRGISGVTRY